MPKFNSAGKQLQYLTAVIVFFLISNAMIDKDLHTTHGKSQSMATVKGTVMDSNGSAVVIPQPTIVFKRNEEIRRVVVNENGGYEISLPPGVYSVTTEISSFHPLRRAEFCLLPGNSVMINLFPSPRFLVRGTTVSLKESVDLAAPVPKYDEFDVPGRGLFMLIQFEKRRAAKNNIAYSEAMMTYDALTIYADKLSFNKEQLRLLASGRVVVEDGKQRLAVKQASVTFKEGEPKVDLMGEVCCPPR